MIKEKLNNTPRSLNADYELAVINSAKRSLNKSLKISGCFFHLSQALYKKTANVIEAFEYVTLTSPSSFIKVLRYFERTYVGKMKTHKKTQNKKQTSNNTLARVKPRFPIEFWSVYERVLKNQPRTNNHVETWHSAIKGDVRKNMNLFKVLELLQNEQSNTENCRKYIERGDNIRARPSRKDQKREERIEKLVKSYATNNSSEWKSLLEGIAANMGTHKAYKRRRGAKNRNIESEDDSD